MIREKNKQLQDKKQKIYDRDVRILEMQSSKFWKMRNQYIQLKNKFK